MLNEVVAAIAKHIDHNKPLSPVRLTAVRLIPVRKERFMFPRLLVRLL